MDNIQINRLNPDTFEYQTYDVTDESLIAISNLDNSNDEISNQRMHDKSNIDNSRSSNASYHV